MGRPIALCKVAIMLLSFPALAGAPPFIPVQGFLTDASGAALNESVDMRFTLYDDALAGIEIWSETQTISVENGIFLAYLGQTASLELSIFDAFENLYLGITVGSDSEMRRIQLASVPFSGYSAHSSYLGSGGIYISDDNVISADLGSTVESIEISDGTIAAADIGANAVTSAHVEDGTIASEDIRPDAITSAHITDGSVGSTDIGAGAVTTTEILDGTILPEDLAPGTGSRVDWEPLDINLGSLPFAAGTSTLDLPAQIPAGAREVLVYLWYEKGNNGPDARYHYRIYTREGATQYAMKFLGRSYNNQAWAFNSDNFWLPVTSERRIHIELAGAITGNRNGEIHLLGHR